MTNHTPLTSAAIPLNIYWASERDDFIGASKRMQHSMGRRFRERWIARYKEFPTSREEALARVKADIPEGVYFNSDAGNFYDVRGLGMGTAFYEDWIARAHEFPKNHKEIYARRLGPFSQGVVAGEAAQPEIVPGSLWKHHSGRIYKVLYIANDVLDPKPKYPPTVVYENVSNGTKWAGVVSDWHRRMTLIGHSV